MRAVIVVDPAHRLSQLGDRVLLSGDTGLELLDGGGIEALAFLDGAAGKEAGGEKESESEGGRGGSHEFPYHGMSRQIRDFK